MIGLRRRVSRSTVLCCILLLTATGCSSGGNASPASGGDTETTAFLFHDGEGPDAGGEYSQLLGCNTVPIYIDDWARSEPQDDAFDFSSEISDSTGSADHVIARIGLLHTLAWSGPEAIPDWVDADDIDGTLRTEYLEFVAAAVAAIVERGIAVDLYLVELEANYAGFEIAAKPDATNDWIVGWIAEVAATVRAGDPEAKVVIPLTPSDLRPGEIVDDPTDADKLLATDFVQLLIDANVEFDAVGFNVAAGAYDRVDDWTTIADYLETWRAFDKELFVWALGFPAENHPAIPMNFPRAEGYSESWQAEQYAQTMELLLADERVLGVSIDLFDYQESGWPEPISWGLVAGDRDDPVPRASFEAVQAVWEENAR